MPFVYEPAVYDGTNTSLTSAVSSDGRSEIGKRYRIPPRCGVAVRLREGQFLSRLRVESQSSYAHGVLWRETLS